MTYYNSEVDHGGDTLETLAAEASSIEFKLDRGVAAVKAFCEAEDICLSDVVDYLVLEAKAKDAVDFTSDDILSQL